MRKTKETWKIWTILWAFMLFAGWGLLVYAATSSGGLFDQYKSNNLTYWDMTGVLTAETWDAFMSTLNTWVIVPSCQPGEYLDTEGGQCRTCSVWTYSPWWSITECIPCSNKPVRVSGTSYYTNYGTNNNCPWTCIEDYYAVSSDACSDRVSISLDLRAEESSGGGYKITKVRVIINDERVERDCELESNWMGGDQEDCTFGPFYRYSIEKATGNIRVQGYVEANNGAGSMDHYWTNFYPKRYGGWSLESLDTPILVSDLSDYVWVTNWRRYN